MENLSMEKKLSFEDYAPKLGAWADSFRPFIESEKMFDIMTKVKSDAGYKIICPDSANTFRAFATCPPQILKVIFYLMDPYPRKYYNKSFQATGIAMDCSNSPDDKLQPSLEKFYEGMGKDLGFRVEASKNLEYLQEQGVMLLNTDLTCRLGETESHKGLWQPFQQYFLEEVLRGTQLIYVLAGKSSQELERFISPFGNVILRVDHPSYAARNKTEWNHQNIFTKINKYLEANEKDPIIWDRRKYVKDSEDLPF